VGDQVHDRDGVLHRRADHPGQVVLADEGGAGTVSRRVQVQHRRPLFQVGEDRFDQGSAQDRGGHGHAHHVQVVQGSPGLRDGLVDMRHGGGGEGMEAVGVALDHGGVLVVDETSRGDGLVAVLAVRQLGRRREHLHFHPGSIHETQPILELLSVCGPNAALRGRVGPAEIDHQVEVVVGPVVGVYIDPHGPLLRREQCRSSLPIPLHLSDALVRLSFQPSTACRLSRLQTRPICW
jgi:hypothetical protein